MGNEARSRVASGKHGHTLISDAKFRRLYELALERAQHADGDGLNAAMASVAADLRSDDVVVVQERGSVAEFDEQVITALSGAVADRLRKSGRLTVIVCRGPGSDPILLEAHQLADDAKLPVLFVEDRRKMNGATTKTSPPLPQKIGAMPAIPVDAEDVIAIYRVAHESMARAREGSGPTRIQCMRWPSDNNGDAVGHLEEWLTARGLPAQAWRREILAELQARHGSAGNGAEDIQELRLAQATERRRESLWQRK
ncbi:MAG TPA: thiamine pyrophosphate-dependent enzyme [Acidobacteriaceae bacterium]|jgi:TPP-dependent pyruvate/acetoin dehydrogenase alpha subunit|nr:thiamine pyrophosphate-dependent enzyme [Acidobacteriaceae bacterium]